MKSNYLCIHAHFYQPPRESPWLEAIDYQESAQPYHDWNQRISAECYNPNGQSRILDNHARVVRLTNNYSRISFNFGATVLSWMEENDPDAYNSIIEGDKLSLIRFNGHGSAIAQAYNHIILPLASRRDKVTQVKWGLRDFEKRFGRKAEAMWLPETAVDTETLEILAEQGLKYVILAPRQADSIRKAGDAEWTSVRNEKIDTRQAYEIALPKGRSIAAFFYDGSISQAVAFEGLLNNGETFAHRLTNAFDGRQGEQLLHLATDGESYGHHHRHGDMALAYALDSIDRRKQIELVNYGLYLEKFPPKYQVRIFENSSWSCVHGIERWRSNCGCNGGMGNHWTQAWRGPLRDAMNLLRDRLELPFEKFMSPLTDDPWAMRDDYIDIILDRSKATRHAFMKRWLKPGIDIAAGDTEKNILKAMELQRNLLLIYTSCAWFFDEISGTETVQDILYGVRAIELARELFDLDLEDEFVAILKTAPSNIPEFGDGQYVYEHLALPAKVDFMKLAAHLAAKTLFMDKIRDASLYCFDYKWKHIERLYSGKSQLICASVTIQSQITLETQDIEFVLLHLGDHNISVGALPFSGEVAYKAMAADFSHVFSRGDLAKSLRLLDKYFEGNLFSLNDFFQDQRREVIDTVFSQTLKTVEDQFQNLYRQYYSVIRYLSDINVTLPPVFSHIARFVQSRDIQAELTSPEIDVKEIERRIHEARQYSINLDSVRIKKVFSELLNNLFLEFQADPDKVEALRQFTGLLEVKPLFNFDIDIGNIQTSFAKWLAQSYDRKKESPEWNELLETASGHLKILFPPEA